MHHLFKSFLADGKHIHPLVIMLIDTLLLLFSFALAYLLIVSIRLKEAALPEFLFLAAAYAFVAIPTLYAWRLHNGLLRYSNTMDLFKVFAAVICYTSILFILFFIAGTLTDLNTFPYYFILIFSFFISITFLVIFRLTAKTLYSILSKNLSDSTPHRVLIYGSDKNAVLVKQALESDRETNYIICGFIDTDRTRLNSYLEQKKVYHFKDLGRLKKRKHIDELLIVNENLDERSKRVVIERCIRNGIKVLTVPPTSNWLSGKFSKNQIQKLRIEDLLQRPPIQINQENVRKDLHNKRVLVTGAAGSIGSEIVRQIAAYGPSLLILCDQAESPLHEIQLEITEHYPHVQMEVVLMDICNFKRLKRLFATYLPEVVFHAAAYKHVPLVENNPFEAVAVNVGGTKNVADLAIQYHTEKFVMISTDKAVNPTNVMGASKRLAEIYTQSLNDETEHHTRFITTRFGNVLGSSGSVIPRFRQQIERGGPITVTHPEITRYFMTIPEAVQLVLEAGTVGRGERSLSLTWASLLK